MYSELTHVIVEKKKLSEKMKFQPEYAHLGHFYGYVGHFVCVFRLYRWLGYVWYSD